MRRPLLIALAILCVVPAAAPAKLTRLPGTGETPTVEVDAAGTALVAWYLRHPGGEAIALCRIPRGTSACPAPQILDATQGATSGVQPPVIRIDGSSVSLVAARQYVVSMQSADGGATFGPMVPISEGTYFTGAIGADGAVALGFGPRFTVSRVGGPIETRTLDLNPGFGSFEAVGFAGRRPVYVSGGRAPTTAVSHWKGSGDIFDRSTWTRRRGPAMVYYDLDSGPRGLWLVHERRRGLDDDVVVRRWRRGRFGPARAIPRSAGNVIGTAIAQDARGRLAVAWYDSRGDRIRVAASRNGRRWSRARTLGGSAGIQSTMSIGLGPDGRGLVVTDQGLVSRPLLAGRVNVRRLTRRSR
jgi:hypothetical protein